MSKRIRVLLADDHPAMRLGLRVLLEQAADVAVVGEAGDGEQTLALLEALQPDVVVLDCEMPGLTGVEVAQEIRRWHPAVQVLALSAYDSEHYVRGMLEAGAVGYLLKEEAPGVIVAAVRGAARGAEYFSPRVAARVNLWARGEWPAGLTGREVEVLRLVAEGLSNKEIAGRLGLAESTVEYHVSNVLRKLEVPSRAGATAWAKEQGIVA
ncbi:MAG: response regulator transcription factor [Anaerolineae bacterium]|nr:response regulator transcription factor [Anaerolineae bacterium]